MTNQEAIKELKARKEHYEMGDGCEFLVEALNMAIEALKTQSKLENIKAEIERLPVLENAEITHGLLDDAIALDSVLEIIDKHT